MRHLIFVPMIHPAQHSDIPELKEFNELEETKRVQSKVVIFWSAIAAELKSMGFLTGIKLSGVHIFIDSIPKGVAIEEITKFLQKLANEGDPLSRICLEIAEQGGKIEGVEDKKLIIESVPIAIKTIKTHAEAMPAEFLSLIHARNKIIVRNIDELVPDGEGALLFLGDMHKQIIFDFLQLLPERRFEVLILKSSLSGEVSKRIIPASLNL